MTSGSAGDPVIAAGCPVAPGGYDAPPVPLGPESLTWKYFGDWRGLLQGLWNGSMQNMHPQLGAGVEQHSTFFRERVPRLMRSLYPIGGVVFDGDREPRTAPRFATTTSTSKESTPKVGDTTRSTPTSSTGRTPSSSWGR